LASTDSTPDNTTARYVVCRAGGSLYAVLLEEAREILPLPRLTRLPGAPGFIPGLANVRGTIVTVVDLAGWFGADTAPRQEAWLMVVNAGGGELSAMGRSDAGGGDRAMGFAVDEVHDVVSFEGTTTLVGGEQTRVLDVGALITHIAI